jgi:hypothetical protein
MSQVPGTGTWLKADDVGPNETVKIVSEAVWEETNYKNEDGSAKNQYVCNVSYRGEERKFKLTMKSCENLSVYGKDSKEWIGKEIKLTVKDVEVGGKDRKTIRAFPIGEAAVQTPVDGQPSATKEAWDD